MELESKELRYCLSIDCNQLKNRKCKAKECPNSDKKVAIQEKRAMLIEVKHGGNS